MKSRILLGAVGVAMICFAIVDAIGSPDLRPSRHLIRLVGVVVLHDAVWMPVVAVAGAIIHQVVPGRYRAIIQGALIVTASVTFVALPFILGYGRSADVPSALPRNYVGGYAILLGTVWLVAIALALRRQRSARPATQSSSASPHDDPSPRQSEPTQPNRSSRP